MSVYKTLKETYVFEFLWVTIEQAETDWGYEEVTLNFSRVFH